MTDMPRIVRSILRMIPLLSVIVLSCLCALLLRFDFQPPLSAPWIWIALGIFVVVKSPVFWASRLHLGSWRTATLFDLHRIALANMTASGLAALMIAVMVGPVFPRSVYVLDAILCFL